MIKQFALALCVGVMALESNLAYGAREQHRFEVSVDIPNLGFYVIPTHSDWIHREQVLPWNFDTSKLGGLRKHFDVRHDTSAIEARLEAEPYISNGIQNIFLRVSFNGNELSHDPQPREVVSVEQAMEGGRFLLDIQPIVPVGGYKPGNYYGNVRLIFNAAAP
ncbi:CS1 type fimbrial major subunit [Pseudomonas sp. NPDC087346]|uniref:CS1 type fimbrial major subunit n=1 Tax=Pseudomonas sp. NPDC087346 TaxID=3364438 RepID=UPI00380CF220